MTVSKRLRYEVLRRDNHACRYCGAAAPDAKLTVDHVLPVALGGTDEPGNLVTACNDCNAGKAASNPDSRLVEAVSADALRWAAAIRRAADIRAAELESDEELLAWFETVWTKYWWGSQEMPTEDRIYFPRPSNWEQSVLRFISAGLERHFLSKAVRIAVVTDSVDSDDVFRYFCGICWRELSQRQEIASKIISADEVEAAD